MLLADVQGLGGNPWGAVTEAVKRHPAGWLFAALCVVALAIVLVKVSPVVVKAIQEDRESKRKYDLARLRLKKQIEDRRAQKKEEPK